MDAIELEAVERALVWEAARKDGPPAGFPPFPEVPSSRYTDAGFYDLEVESIWRQSWFCIGHVNGLNEPGQFRVFDKLEMPIVVVRGKDRVLRAFFNTCQHRGARVVKADCGKTNLLRCPYHAWSYNLEGALVGVPDQHDFVGFEKSSKRLVQVRCAEWNGLIFLSGASDPEPIEAYLNGVADDLAPIDIAGMREVGRVSAIVNCNWKAAIDAFLEVYHINAIHPETVGKMLNRSGAVMKLYRNGHSRMFSERVLSTGVNFGEYPDAPSVESVPDYYRRHSCAFFAFPNLVMPIDGVGFPVQLYWPIDKDKCEMEIIFLGPDWGEGPRPEFWEGYLEIFQQILQEDVENLESIQASMRSGALAGMTLSYQERRIYWFHEELDRRIGPSRLRDDQVVPLLLESHKFEPIPRLG